MNAVVLSMRLPFLVLTPACVSVGVATASVAGVPVDWANLWLAMIAALAAHIGVNTLNEYQDFRSGLDLLTARTPFSGGSGALIATPGAADAVRLTAIGSLAVTALAGLYFTVRFGFAIVPLGLSGMLIIVLYTDWLNRRPWLCMVAPGLAFGPLMVVGTHFVLTGHYSSLAAYTSLVPFVMVNNLLLLNQYPDRNADREVGRRHLLIAYGPRFSTRVYGAMLVLASLIVVLGVIAGWLPLLCLLTLVPLMAGVWAYTGARRYGEQTARLTPYLGWNVLAAVGSPLVLAGTLAAGV